MNRQSILLLSFVTISILVLGNPEITSWSKSESPTVLSKNDLVIQELVSGLDEPSGFEFVGNKDILVTQKNDGKVKVVRNFDLKKYDILDVNVFNHTLDSGISGITSAAIGNFTYIFLFYIENPVKDPGNISPRPPGYDNSIYRYIWDPSGLTLSNDTLVLDLPSTSAANSGGKPIIGPDNQLYVVIGDLFREGRPQNMPGEDLLDHWLYDNKSESGAVLRTTIDGKPSSDNPINVKGFEQFYGSGVKKAFGLAIDPVTGYLWDTEEGLGGLNEINLIKPGFNSGWGPLQELSNHTLNLGSYYYEPKFVSQGSSFSLSDLVFMNSSSLGNEYTNDLFVGDLQGNIYNFDLDKNRENIIIENVISDHVFATGFGSVSNLKIGPDNALYVLAYTNATRFQTGISGSLYRIATNTIDLPFLESQTISADNLGLVGTLAVVIAILVLLKYHVSFLDYGKRTSKRLTPNVAKLVYYMQVYWRKS